MALVAAGVLASATSCAQAAFSHVVQPGETLSGIAATDGVSLSSLAAYNGISPTTYVIAGQTIEIPAVGATSGSSTSTASSGATHVVQPGETLWGIAEADGVPESSLAAFNGLSPTAYIIIGQTLSIPSATTSSTSSSSSSTATSSSPPVPGLAPIYCSCGTVYLRSDAAAAWGSMRQASIADFGIDLYPDGPLSAYRTYAQQSFLYNSFLDGTGAPADPPGTSSHELGTAVDVATPPMRWAIDQIGAQYGWGKIHGPGEWWHVDYLR